MWRGLLNGTFQVVSSDHAPFRFDKSGKLFHGVDHRSHVLRVGLGQHAVAEVEHVPGRARARENIRDARADLREDRLATEASGLLRQLADSD